jgi:acetyl-CoA C-acetyltransferase
LKNDKDVVIVSGVRTPFGKYGGLMVNMISIHMGAMVIKEALKRVNFPGDKVDEVFYGTCEPLEYGMYMNVPARQALILAGLPVSTVSMTLDTACCSSMDAADLATRSIKLGISRAVLALGADNMPHQAYYMDPAPRWGGVRGDLTLVDPMKRGGTYSLLNGTYIGVEAGQCALDNGVTREMQDLWGFTSQSRYAAAHKAGKFKEEMMPLQLKNEKGETITLEIDEQHRVTAIEKLAKLPTIYNGPTVTAGNAPGLNAGASCLLLMTREMAKEYNIKPLGRIVSQARTAGVPNRMAEEPANAIATALKKANLTLDDMKLIELNEAFAAVTLTSIKLLAKNDDTRMKALLDKTNVNGGAIAIGHPVGASAARLIMTMLYELKRRGGGYGVASLCGGASQAAATIVEAE